VNRRRRCRPVTPSRPPSSGRPKGGHALAILPGLTHYNLATSPLFAAATLAFLDQQPT
jgi:hypothetical protein